MHPDSNLSAHPAPDTAPRLPLLVVGVGGSAGALPGLIALLESIEGQPQLAMVVVLHLSPDHESHSVEILQRATALQVTQVTQRTRLRPGHVYVIAPGKNLVTEDGFIQPGEATLKRPSTVIDLFFRTLAEVHRENAVGVILSGTGSDGTLGLAKIKECGGLTIAQTLGECEHPDMARAAKASGMVDLTLGAPEIGKRLSALARPDRLAAPATAARPRSYEEEDLVEDANDVDIAFHDILNALRARTRHDFRHYKRATLLRRLERRIQVNELASIPAYRDFVRDHPEELEPLLADMLISVTNFFRDPQAFDALEQRVIPGILESIPAGDEARIWIPACASGEESYSMAILLQEQAERLQSAPRVQLFASDINEAALDLARHGAYPANVAADISEARLRTFFTEVDEQYRVRPRLRESIIFARHNVLSDPPFSRLDLICCRNLLIYLDRTAQAAVLNMFAYALKPGGYLFLGNAESTDAASEHFETVSKEHRIYRLVPEAATFSGARLPPRMSETAARTRAPAAGRAFATPQSTSLAGVHERALAATTAPSVLISPEHDIERVSPGAGRFVAFGEGAPTRNLLNNVPSDIRLELRTLLFRASETGQSVQTVFKRAETERRTGESATLTLSLHPVRDGDQLRHWLVLFDQKAEAATAQVMEQPGKDSVPRSMYERLEADNRTLKSHLQDTLDRSAVSNEELKASNEELQAINEELMSAKEELETSKEELQSMNEELSTVNAELRIKVDEGTRNNDDLRNLMEASHIATVFVDPQMRVKRFTPHASTLFSLIPSDIGRPLMDVKSRLDYSEIINDATAAFQQLQPIERSVTSVDEEHYLARILPYRTSHDSIGGAVLTFVDVTALRRAELRVLQTEDRLRAAIASSKDFAVLSTDNEGRILTWNEGARLMFGYTEQQAIGQLIDMLFTEADRARGIPDQERRVARRDGRASDERWHLRRDGSTFFCSGVMTTVSSERGVGYIKIARDVSDGKLLEQSQQAELGSARRSVESAQAKSDMRDRFLAVMSHELKQPLNLILVNAELLVRIPEGQASPRLMRIGQTIMRAVSTQETIVNDLLDLSRVQTGKLHLTFAPTDLTDIVQRFSDAMAEDAARKKIKLTVNLPAPALICDCDPVRIEQVVWNLMGNAIKFTPDGGTVQVSLRTDNGHALLSVKDSGVGITADFLPNIFELFNQGDVQNVEGQRRPGLGIGLALVRELVHAHDGRITAESAGLGLGSTFTVCLPLRSHLSPQEGESCSLARLNCRVLMVDDDADALATLSALIEMEGAVVVTASGGQEALSQLAAGSFDVLVSDVGMPIMNGYELIRRAHAQLPDSGLRSIAVTGYGSDLDEREALEAGFDAFLTKPITVARLKAALLKLLDK